MYSGSRYRYGITKGSNGGCVYRRRRKKEKILSLHPDLLKKGITNANGSEMSGRTNIKNNRLHEGERKSAACCNLYTGDGTRYHYHFLQRHYYLLKFSQTPTEHKLLYKYQRNSTHLEHVQMLNKEKRVANELFFSYPSPQDCKEYAKERRKRRKTKPLTVEVGAPDGRKVVYTLKSYGKYKKENRFAITQVRRPHGPDESYTYEAFSKALRMTAKKRPDGRFLTIKYYPTSSQFQSGKVEALAAPVGLDDQPVIFYQFSYVGDKRDKDGTASTTVKSLIRLPSVYEYSLKTSRLHSLTRGVEKEGYYTQTSSRFGI